MVTPAEIKVRQFIWAEYRAGSTKEQALINITAKLGHDSVSATTIDEWYQKFKRGKISLFDFYTEQYYITNVVQKLPNGDEKDVTSSILFLSTDCTLNGKMINFDGRFAIFKSRRSEFAIVAYDLFHGEKKELQVSHEVDHDFDMCLIGYELFFVPIFYNRALLKFDFDSWETTIVSRECQFCRCSIVTDQLNERNFVIIELYGGFLTGRLIGDEMVLGQCRDLDLTSLHSFKLVGNQLFAFRSSHVAEISVSQYVTIDLITLDEQIVDVPFPFDRHYSSKFYYWQGNRLYVALKDHWGQNERIFMFDSENLTWTDTRIAVYGRVRSIFVNENHVMTLQASKSDFSVYTTVYRFTLKKPDSLKNLAWLAIRRHAMLFGGQIYDKIKDHLPYCQRLRNLFVSDYE